MDQIKVGKFIAACRKDQNLTQMQLAEKLGITDRAVSKWETGKTMPDSAIMLELCEILGITVNDLLNGECIALDDYAKKTTAQLMEALRRKEIAEKQLLKIKAILEVVAAIFFIIAGVVFIFDLTTNRFLIILLFCLMLLSIAFQHFCLKVDQTVGYFQCAECKHTYVPTEDSLTLSLGFGRKKVLECPHCKKNTTHIKVTTKE